MKRVPLVLTPAPAVGYGAWPVTVGVPFADHELAVGESVRVVTGAGVILPTQTTCLATWAADRRWVKWLLVDFQADLESSDGLPARWFLEYGSATPLPTPRLALRVDRGAEAVAVHNGPLRLHVCEGRLQLSLHGDAGAGDEAAVALVPYVHAQSGQRFEASRSALNVSIEDEGPLRVAVCIRGVHEDGDGRQVLPYILRLHLYAGRPFVRCFHTFVFDQSPDDFEIAKLGVDCRITAGSERGVWIGGTEGPLSGRRQGRMLQSDDRSCRVDLDGHVSQASERTDAWAGVECERGCIGVVLRDAWKEYPKAITVSETGVNAELWAEGEACLSFAQPFREPAILFNGTRDAGEFARLVRERPTAPLNLKSLNAWTPDDLAWVEAMIKTHAPDRPASYNDTGTDDARGAAKTSEMLLSLTLPSAAPAEEWSGIARCVQEPVVAAAAADYMCQTKALRPLTWRDPATFREAQDALDDMFAKVVEEPRQKLRNYGMIGYGDLMCSHSASPWALWMQFKDTPDVAERMKYCSRAYNNEANDQVNALWCLFLHSGRREHFLAAEAYGEHLGDVDIKHLGPQAGLMHYHNANHWSGGGSPSHTCTAGLMRQYYLTGNRRLLEVCAEAANWALAHQEPCGVFSNRGGYLVREFTSPLANLLEYYQAEWSPEYGGLARRSLKWMLLALPQPGQFPVSIFTAGAQGDEAVVEQDGWHSRHIGGMTPELLGDAVRLFPDEPLFTSNLLALAYRYVNGMESSPHETMKIGDVAVIDPAFNAPLIAYAYEVTRDPRLGAACWHFVEDHFRQRATDFTFSSVAWGSIIPAVMYGARLALHDHGEDRLERERRQWIEEIAARHRATPPPEPRPAPSRRSLGVIPGFRDEVELAGR